MQPKEFLTKAYEEAKKANHIWPEIAACEAALESGWGESNVAKKYNNLFGQKKGSTTIHDEGRKFVSLPTVEYNHVTDRNEPCMAEWPVFVDWADCFRERMQVLCEAHNRQGLIYQAALNAKTAEDFAVLVSQRWATDPLRGNKVLQIYRKHGHEMMVDYAESTD